MSEVIRSRRLSNGDKGDNTTIKAAVAKTRDNIGGKMEDEEIP